MSPIFLLLFQETTGGCEPKVVQLQLVLHPVEPDGAFVKDQNGELRDSHFLELFFPL